MSDRIIFCKCLSFVFKLVLFIVFLLTYFESLTFLNSAAGWQYYQFSLSIWISIIVVVYRVNDFKLVAVFIRANKSRVIVVF